ncbi:MAG: LytTR family DNA-binding domain-containing protein [Lachnospiraceae bacterium]
MLELAICDDEKIYRNDLRKILGTGLELSGIDYRITEFSCGEELIKNFRCCDIVFLDIEMGALNGVETAKRLRAVNRQCVIIFVTSHPDFVFQGYEVRALNYIMKPYEPSKIVSVLHTALEELEISSEKYYIVEQRSGSIRVPLNKVKYIFSERRLLHMVTDEEVHTFYGKLGDMEVSFGESFVRVHSRYLVNIRYVEKVDGNAVLVCGECLPVSRSCRQSLSIAFAKYMLH